MLTHDFIVSTLPHLNASLNASAATMLASGYYFIRNKNVRAHKLCMLSALLLSTFFLISYIIYHLEIGRTPFAGTGITRPIYFSILASHVILVLLNIPLVAAVVTYALKGNFARHRRIARWALPIWLYVSISGLVIYFMVFHLYPE